MYKHLDLCRNKLCNDFFCFVVNCQWSAWSQWRKCSAECGTGNQTRSRIVERQAENGGKECDGNNLMYQKCILESCDGGKFIEDQKVYLDSLLKILSIFPRPG